MKLSSVSFVTAIAAIAGNAIASGPPYRHGGLPYGGPPYPHGGSPHPHGGPPDLHGGPPDPHGGPPYLHGGPPYLHGGSPNPHGGPPHPHDGFPHPHDGFPNPHDGFPHPHGGSPYHHAHRQGVPPIRTVNAVAPPPYSPPHAHILPPISDITASDPPGGFITLAPIRVPLSDESRAQTRAQAAENALWRHRSQAAQARDEARDAARSRKAARDAARDEAASRKAARDAARDEAASRKAARDAALDEAHAQRCADAAAAHEGAMAAWQIATVKAYEIRTTSNQARKAFETSLGKVRHHEKIAGQYRNDERIYRGAVALAPESKPAATNRLSHSRTTGNSARASQGAAQEKIARLGDHLHKLGIHMTNEDALRRFTENRQLYLSS